MVDNEGITVDITVDTVGGIEGSTVTMGSAVDTLAVFLRASCSDRLKLSVGYVSLP